MEQGFRNFVSAIEKNCKSCLIWTSLCMLFKVVTIDFHYKTDRQERFDLKI